MTPTITIFLEAHYFAEDSEELRLRCDAVVATAGGLVVAGIETCHNTFLEVEARLRHLLV